MITLDGTKAGGQMVRSALALSCLTKRPFTITNIRAERKTPGLKQQHLTAINFLKEITDAYVEGADLGSERLLFYPRTKQLRANYTIDIKTAGSSLLFLQAVLPFFIMQDKRITLQITGGTDVSWAVPYDYFKWIMLPVLQNIAVIECNLLLRGYYPIGGGKIEVTIRPKPKNSLELLDRGALEYVRGFSHASSDLQSQRIAERQADAASFLLRPSATTSIDERYAPAKSSGSGILVYAQYANYRVGSDVLGGEKSPEVVGREAAENLLLSMREEGVDSHLLDNLIPYLALVGGKVKFSSISEHTQSNIEVTEEFLNVTFRKEGKVLIVAPSEFPF